MEVAYLKRRAASVAESQLTDIGSPDLGELMCLDEPGLHNPDDPGILDNINDRIRLFEENTHPPEYTRTHYPHCYLQRRPQAYSVKVLHGILRHRKDERGL
jgi:hypothetical protein